MEMKLSALNLWKTYNGNTAVKNCSYSFEPRKIYTLMGPNGCGKSTFLRLCALLEEPDAGGINYFSDNNALKKGVELRRKITLVLPKVGVFNATVFKNAAYGLKIRGMRKKDIEEKVEKILEFVGLTDKKRHNALTLSSGEAQRLGIARALVIEPEIIFLDEPTASIDEKNTGIVEEIILKINKQKGTAIIMATHDVSQAERLGGNILLMREGSFLI
ncbi:MAG: ATP-binding cassette domain-containing protein [Nitrospirae bacterium]|nr:ATP-binding cassette domain-containing protein [Nitrospirota bacterium]